jgi:phosphopantetheinyl transferase (holo-ACP synthase)
LIGNDIIDLQTAAAESNWRRPGYLGKIFTPQEQDWIFQSPDPDITVWYLWSAKEAVYKIVNRTTNERKYAPLAYVCTDIGTLFHQVLQKITSCTLPEPSNPITKSGSPLHKNTHTITSEDSPVHKSRGLITISAGKLLHENTTYYFTSYITPQYLHTIAVTNPAHFPLISITTDPSIPYQKDTQGKPMVDNRPISVSHHGRYYAMVKALI